MESMQSSIGIFQNFVQINWIVLLIWLRLLIPIRLLSPSWDGLRLFTIKFLVLGELAGSDRVVLDGNWGFILIWLVDCIWDGDWFGEVFWSSAFEIGALATRIRIDS